VDASAKEIKNEDRTAAIMLKTRGPFSKTRRNLRLPGGDTVSGLAVLIN